MTLARERLKYSSYQVAYSNKTEVVIFCYYNQYNAFLQKFPMGTYFCAINTLNCVSTIKT